MKRRPEISPKSLILWGHDFGYRNFPHIAHSTEVLKTAVGLGWLVRSLIGLAQRVGMAPPILSFTASDLESLISSRGFEIVENETWDEKAKLQGIVARKRS